MNFKFEDGKKLFFTSDTHFNHTNILKYCARPFDNIKDMNEALIKNWNDNVKPDDIVFHLGDVCFGNPDEYADLVSQLNGHKILIKGNHDFKFVNSRAAKYFDDIFPQLSINVAGQKILMNHYPYLCFAGSYGQPGGAPATWQLFGHVHSGPRTQSGLDCQRLTMLFPTQYDVGVDNNNYTPVNYYEVKEIIDEQVLSQNLYRK